MSRIAARRVFLLLVAALAPGLLSCAEVRAPVASIVHEDSAVSPVHVTDALNEIDALSARDDLEVSPLNRLGAGTLVGAAVVVLAWILSWPSFVLILWLLLSVSGAVERFALPRLPVVARARAAAG